VAINTEMLHTAQGTDGTLGVQGREQRVAGFTGENGGEREYRSRISPFRMASGSRRSAEALALLRRG
jgi:hypothetical protein